MYVCMLCVWMFCKLKNVVYVNKVFIFIINCYDVIIGEYLFLLVYF